MSDEIKCIAKQKVMQLLSEFSDDLSMVSFNPILIKELMEIAFIAGASYQAERTIQKLALVSKMGGHG